MNDENNLAKYNIFIIEKLMVLFDIKVPILLASTIKYGGKGNSMNIDILNKVGASHYLSGVGAKDYHEDKPFNDANIQVIWQNFTHPVYKQLHGDFIPYLSSIDLLFNCGIERSREILREC